MSGGCIKNLFATVGCVTVLVLAAVGGWHFRDRLSGAYRSLAGRDWSSGGGSVDSTIGAPSSTALRSAERKESEMARRQGVGYVLLTADEIASLVESRLAPVATEAVDALRVILREDRLALTAQVRIDVFSRDLLGPIAGLLGGNQPLRMAGEVTVSEPGLAAWRCDEFVIRSFPFPESVIPRLVDRMTGRHDGVFPIPIPETVGEVRVRAEGVTLYRRVE